MAACGADRPAAPLVIQLFGPFDLRQNGAPLPRLRSRRGQWLLALLTLRHGREVERAWLAGTLWPDCPESQSLYNVRRNLADLRRTLGPEARRLHSPSPHSLCLNLAGAAVDLLTFDAAITRGDAPSLETAVSLYRGPLLEGCDEEWAFPERQARAQAYVTALETLAVHVLAEDDAAAAVRYLRRAVAVDPLEETAQRALMQALAASGDYAAATLAYREFRLLLHRELNAAPGPETTALFQQLRAQARGRVALSPVGQSKIQSLRSKIASPPCSLPRPLTELVGREKEVSAIAACLASARLVTLTGTGGVGKTRLAIQVAEEILVDYRDGAWFVYLAPLADPALLPQAVATTLGVREEPGRPLPETLREFLGPQQLLLVLDNCEHLVEACACLVEALLCGCPGLRILATSRQVLGLTGETTWRVPSLSLPPLVSGRWLIVDSPATAGSSLPSTINDQPSTLLQSEAVRLFVQRAEAAVPGFTLTDREAPMLAQLCRQLDGIPLALELAAARLRVLTVEQITARLADRFRLLTGGSRTALPRQQTLRATMDWSWDLLSQAERMLLRRLSVFAGGFTLEAAEAVCAGRTGNEGVTARAASEGDAVLDLLTQLVDRSLVVVEKTIGGQQEPMAADSRLATAVCAAQMRYRLLETTREYGRERLVEAGESEVMRERHRDWCLKLAEQAEAEWRGPNRKAWLERLEWEHDNLRAALESSADAATSAGGSPEAGWRLAGALLRFWASRGHLTEAREWLARVLSLGPFDCRPFPASKARAKALHAAGYLALQQQDLAAARQLLEESLKLWRQLGDRHGEAIALHSLGLQARWEGDDEQARGLHEQSLAFGRALNDRVLTYTSLYMLACEAQAQGDHERAVALHQESLALKRDQGDQSGVAQSLRSLGDLARREGDQQRAEALLNESLSLLRDLGEKSLVASVLTSKAHLAAARGDYRTARSLHAESLALARELGERRDIAMCLQALAHVVAELGQPERAARLLEAGEVLRETIGAPLSLSQDTDYDRHVAAVRASLRAGPFAAARAAGRAMPLDEAVADALATAAAV